MHRHSYSHIQLGIDIKTVIIVAVCNDTEC